MIKSKLANPELSSLLKHSEKYSVIHLAKPKEIPEGYAGIGAGAIFSRKELQTGQISEELLEKILKEPAQGFYYEGEFVPFSPLLNNL